ncbi:hypothetical protein M0813_11452 [Anaeramoeba flamelloides]|uniref:Uncharacterized protein n=1 Tax=Anaeramoeba flamelloides TaxID=1746091 RepID=A0ABQ8ZFE0_9EUKA|nr:hypothetical protein M0813_11452 [Anaeramoeba flamelloides]
MKPLLFTLLFSISLISILCSTEDVVDADENIVKFLHTTHYMESTECQGNYRELTILEDHCYKNLTNSILYTSTELTESESEESESEESESEESEFTGPDYNTKEDGVQSFTVVFCDYEDDCECSNTYTMNYESCYPEKDKEESQYYDQLEINTFETAYIHAKVYNESTSCKGKYTDLVVIDERCYHFEESSARWETQDKYHFNAYHCDVNTECDNCKKMKILYNLCIPDFDKGKSYKYKLVSDPAPKQRLAILLIAIQFLVLYLFK